MVYHSTSTEETAEIAKTFLTTLHQMPDMAMLIGLEGELGAGKTTFVQALGACLGITQSMTSPTFVLMKEYPLHHDPFSKLVHIDAYRLTHGSDLLGLGFKELLDDRSALILIEWPERVADILPKQRTTIHIDHIGPRERRISIN